MLSVLIILTEETVSGRQIVGNVKGAFMGKSIKKDSIRWPDFCDIIGMKSHGEASFTAGSKPRCMEAGEVRGRIQEDSWWGRKSKSFLQSPVSKT